MAVFAAMYGWCVAEVTVMYGWCIAEVTAMYGWCVWLKSPLCTGGVWLKSPLCMDGVWLYSPLCTGGVCRWLNSPLCRLQKVQDSSRKLVFKTRIRDRVQSLLQALHWLPVQARIDYKMSAICHNLFSDSSPAYFSDPFTVYTPSTQPRSSAESRMLPIPQVRTQTFG